MLNNGPIKTASMNKVREGDLAKVIQRIKRLPNYGKLSGAGADRVTRMVRHKAIPPNSLLHTSRTIYTPFYSRHTSIQAMQDTHVIP